MSLENGSRLGHYEVLGLLGAGGMGEVYRARDLTLKREVAIKVLPEELVADEHRLLRFQREAEVLASLNHPHIVTIFSVETQGEIRFFVMELVEGRTLEEVLRGGGLEGESFFDHALAIVDAVAAAHERGITHRDLKPANVMVSDAGRRSAGRSSSGHVKVLDFGLAKDHSSGSPSASSETLSAGLTQAGAVLGTVPYMSPEQLQGRSAESTSDVFSLGVMLYEMATGERPFRGESQAALISAILRDTPRAASEVVAELPSELDAILGRCLEKDPGQRYPTASELRDGLAKLRKDVESGISRVARIPTSVTAAKVFRTPMVGREAEVAQLHEALERAASGRGSLVTLAGDPGVGKTRLAAETMKVARSLGFLALVGNCHEGEGSAPFSPWTEILDGTARIADRKTLRELLGEEGGEIAKLHPGLRRLYPDLPPALELPPAAERAYLFNCFRDYVERSSRVQPLLLVLEDLHWADESTLLLLQHLTERLGEMAVLVVGTYRDVELDVARPLANALRELVRRRLMERIPLGRLAESGVAQMLASLGGREPPRSLVAAIYGETEGNPFFVEEVYAHLAEEGRLFDDEGKWREDLTLEELDVPEGVRLVVGRRLERLDEEGRRVLTAAAVLGRRFSYPVLEAMEVVESDLLLDGIEAAERLRLIESVRSSSPREARYQFAHELIRHTLLQGLAMPRRQRLHLQVAAAMETVHGDAVEEHASAMAHHLYQAGVASDEGKTYRFLTLAADQALSTASFEDALEHLALAFSMQPAESPRERIELLWKRGLARRCLVLWEETIEDWQRALELCDETADRRIIVLLAAELGAVLGWKDRQSEAEIAVQRGLDLLGEEETVERCRLLATMGMLLSSDGQVEAGGEMVAEAITQADALGDSRLRGYARLPYPAWHTMKSSEMLSLAEAAAEILEPTEDLWYLLEARCWRRFARLHLGHPDIEPSAEARAAERIGQHQAGFFAAATRGCSVWLQTADLDRYEECLDEFEDICQRADIVPYWAQSWRAVVCFWRGDWEKARELALEALAHGQPSAWWRGSLFSPLSLVDSYSGRKAEALALLDSPGLLPRHAGLNACGAWVMLIGAVEGLVVLGERQRAAGLYPLLEGAIDTGTVVALWAFRLTQTAAGIGAAAARLWDRAEEHFETALRQADEIPFISEQADARRWYAHMLLDRHGPEDVARARQYLQEAIVIYRRIGMPKHVEMAEALLKKA